MIEDSSTLEVESKIGKPSFIFLAIVSKTKPFISWTFYPGGKKGNWNVQDLEEEIYNVSSTIVPYDTSHLGWYGARVRNDIGSLDLNIELIGKLSIRRYIQCVLNVFLHDLHFFLKLLSVNRRSTKKNTKDSSYFR